MTPPSYRTPAPGTRRPRRRLPLAWLFGLVLLAGSAVGAGFALNVHPGAGSSGGGSSAPASTSDTPVLCFGHVDVPRGVILVVPPQPGRVAKVFVAEDDQELAKDTPLFEMDKTVAGLNVKKAQAAVEEAKKRVEEAKILTAQFPLKLEQQELAIEAAKRNLAAQEEKKRHVDRLLETKNITPAEAKAAAELVEALKSALKAEEKKLEELKKIDPSLGVGRAEQDVVAKEAQLEQAKYAERECVVKAPAKGKVLRLFAHEGDLSGPDAKQPALVFCPSGPRIVRAEVEQEFAGRVAVGQAATIQDDTTARGNWRGKVVHVSDWFSHRRSVLPEPIQLHDVRTLECLIELDDDRGLRINQRVRVTLGR